VELKNSVITVEHRHNSKRIQLSSLKHLRQTFNEEFRMPRCPVENAVETLERITGQDFFAMGEGDPFA
jgi:hypothetical protein